MKNPIIISTRNNAIIISKAFEKAASVFGSEEYKMLQAAKNDNPGYRVVAKSKKASDKKSDHNKGLSYKYMEKYILTHDDESKSVMKEYMSLRSLTPEAQELGLDSADYSDIKNWFLDKFPEIREFLNQRTSIISSVNERLQADKERKAQLDAQSRGFIAA